MKRMEMRKITKKCLPLKRRDADEVVLQKVKLNHERSWKKEKKLHMLDVLSILYYAGGFFFLITSLNDNVPLSDLIRVW